MFRYVALLLVAGLMACTSPEPESVPPSVTAPPPLAATPPDLSAYPDVPEPVDEQLRELHDIERDLAAIARGEAGATVDLADDLGKLPRRGQRPGAEDLRRLAESLSVALGGSSPGDEEITQMGHALYVLMHVGVLNDEQKVLLAETFFQSLRTTGAAGADMDAVIAAVGGLATGS